MAGDRMKDNCRDVVVEDFEYNSIREAFIEVSYYNKEVGRTITLRGLVEEVENGD